MGASVFLAQNVAFMQNVALCGDNEAHVWEFQKLDFCLPKFRAHLVMMGSQHPSPDERNPRQRRTANLAGQHHIT